MARLDDLKQEVEKLYKEKRPERDEWADWLYDNHVLVVTANAKVLAEKYAANPELAQVAALLHDIADYKMNRSNPNHEEESLNVAREVMTEFGYTLEEIALTVDDAIQYHGCHGDQRPKSKEGLVLATADALAHFKTDYYVFTTRIFGGKKTLAEIKKWTLQKIDRDMFNKISFEDERKEVQPDYDMIKNLFSR
jgi:putative nucleotidyltransferase with HDIG domain